MVKLQWFLTTLFIAAATTQSAMAAPSVAPAATPKASAPAPAASSAAQNVDTKPGTVAPPKTAAPVKTPAAAKLPNWVGPNVGKPSKSACYRKTYRTTKKQCGAGYNFDGALTCWTQCPIEYPVECGMECLPQNKDCTKAILKKVTSVVNVALNAATGGLFGSITKAGKLVQTGVKCGQQLFSITNKITEMVEEVEKGAVGATEDTILFAVNKADFVVYDLPTAVATCLGLPAGKASEKVKPVVQKVVNMAVSKKRSGINLKDFKTFLGEAKSVVPTATASIDALSPTDASSLQNIVKSGSSCGMDLNSINNKVIAKVQSLKTENPGATTDVIKFAVLNSDIVLKDLPQAASRCAAATKNPSSREAAAADFQSRDGVIKTVHAMIDRVVEASSKDGKPVSNADFGLSVANMGLDAIATVDPTGIAAMASEFMQSVCGPTAYIGDVDTGAADQALGLNTIEKAFRGSTGTWNAKGDGQLKITFKSSDDKDVKVNVHSGGKKKYQVKVKKGSTVEWSKPLSEFQGKTLYMDRWRTGLLNIAGTGGGSMLVWVPNNKDGALTLTVQINPTSLKNHGRRLRN